FFLREAKRRLGTALDVVERWDDAALARFKTDVKQGGERAAKDVVAALGSWDAWAWNARDPLPQEPKGLDANPRVHAALSKIGAELAAVLEKHGVPDAASAREAYKLPSYFVAGRFMKSLVESYWRGLNEHVELSRVIDEAGTKERRGKFEQRWEKA